MSNARMPTEFETFRFSVEMTVVAIKASPEHPETTPAAMRGFAKVLRAIAENAPVDDEPGKSIDFAKGVSDKHLFADEATTKLVHFNTRWERMPH